MVLQRLQRLMEKEDGRKLTRQAQHERRKQAVRLHRRGMSYLDIAHTLGISSNTARSAVRVANAQGLRALAPKPTGVTTGQQRTLSSSQQLQIQRLICQNRPEQLKMDFALWTRTAVMLLVKQEYGVELPAWTPKSSATL